MFMRRIYIPATKAKQTQRRPTSSLSPTSPLFSNMTDSYSSAHTDHTTNGFTNPLAPSLVPNPHASTIIRKKLMGYVGFANLPNQVHRKSVRKGFQFTAMVVGTSFSLSLSLDVYQHAHFLHSGESGLGKSTLINTLFNTPLYPPKEPLAPADRKSVV